MSKTFKEMKYPGQIEAYETRQMSQNPLQTLRKEETKHLEEFFEFTPDEEDMSNRKSTNEYRIVDRFLKQK